MFDDGKHIIHMLDPISRVEFFLISPELCLRCADTLESVNAMLPQGEQSYTYHFSSCVCADKVFAYMLSRELWEKSRRALKAAEEELAIKAGKFGSEAIKSFKEFLLAWDFDYEYSPKVQCPCCQSQTSDWRTDPHHLFSLSNANTGGLLVFHCRKCGATIRQKHFKDTVAYEYTEYVPIR